MNHRESPGGRCCTGIWMIAAGLMFMPAASWPVSAATPAAGQAMEPMGVDLQCLDAANKRDLRQAGGGPGGAQWNTREVVCTAGLSGAADGRVTSIALKFHIVQGQRRVRVSEMHVPNPPWAQRCLPCGARYAFHVPAYVLGPALQAATRQKSTGATIYKVRFVLTAHGHDSRGKIIATAADEVVAEMAFGE